MSTSGFSHAPLSLAALLVLAVVLAGCHAPDDTDTTPGTDPGGMGDVPAFMDVEKGTALTSEEIAAMVALYDDQPLSDSQSPWPAHRLKWITDDTFILTHWNNDDPSQATALNWIGIGKKGVFCSEDRPGPESIWRHFHSYDAPTYNDGHGGETGESGYWLMHIAVRSFEAPWGPVAPGVDSSFMLTPAPDCGTVPAASFGAEVAVPMTPADIASFLGVYDDQPLSASQSPWPAHGLKWVTEDTFILTHWNNDDPSLATNMNWIGVGKAGVFCASDRPGAEAEWRHFHSYDAPTYADGHGGETGETGYWLLHAAVRSFEAPWGAVEPGLDSQFMLTPAPTC